MSEDPRKSALMIPSRRRQILSWCLFDFANSSFTTVVVTTVYNVWFTSVVAADHGTAGATKLWNICLFASNLLIIASAPIVGAAADHSAKKKCFLFASYAVCVAFTALLATVGRGDVALGMVAFIIANFAYASGENLVAGFLPDLAEPEDMGRVSALGWAIGYAGGLSALGLVFVAIDVLDWSPRSSNLIVAAFFLLGGIPTFLWVRERRRPTQPIGLKSLAVIGFRQVLETLRRRREHPQLFRFLLAYVVFNVGIYGVIGFAGIYARELFDIPQARIILVLMVTQVAAGAGALWSARLTRRLGCLRTLELTLAIWFVAGAIALAAHGRPAFWTVALLAGFAMGASLPAARAAVGRFAPLEQSAEIFGLWGLCARLAVLAGTAGNWLLIHLTGSLRSGIALFTASFLIGLVLLRRVDEERGLAEARHATWVE